MEWLKKFICFGIIAICVSNPVFAIDNKQHLLGKKLTSVGASCSGLSISKNGKDAFMYGELGQVGKCTPDLNLRIKWISDNTFILIEKDKVNDTSPPRTYLYKIKSIKNNNATLVNMWTGWGDFKDEEEKYIIK